MIGLEVLTILSFGLAFLLADAHIFGVDASAYVSVYRFQPMALQKAVGILPLRPYLMRLKFFYELFQCYFCMGVWTGMTTHLLLNELYKDRYVLYHNPTWQAYLMGVIVAAMWSAPTVYVVNQVVTLLESHHNAKE